MTKTKQLFNTIIFTSLLLITIFMFAACGSKPNEIIKIKSGINFNQPYASYQTKTYTNSTSVANYLQSVAKNEIKEDAITRIKSNVTTNECITYSINCSYTDIGEEDSNEYINNFIKRYTNKYTTKAGWTPIDGLPAWYKTIQNYDVMIIVDKTIQADKFIIKISSFRFTENFIKDDFLSGEY